MNIEINVSKKPPVILVDSEPVSFAKGIRAILAYKNWAHEDMAHYLKVSSRTVDGWLIGRKPSNSALVALSYMIK